MSAQGVYDSPNVLKFGIIVKNWFRVSAKRDDDWNYYVTEFFMGSGTHDAPDGLNNIDFGAFCGHKNDCIKRGHVNAFGKAADVVQNSAIVAVSGSIFEFLQFGGALCGGHGDGLPSDFARAVDKIGVDFDERISIGFGFVSEKFFLNGDKIVGELFRVVDTLAKGNGGVHELIGVVF